MAFKILETVLVKHGDGFLRINACDFDPGQHTLFEDNESPEESMLPVANGRNTPARRQKELETESWQTLKSLAAELDPPVTEKPDGGWDEVIPLILAKEFD